MEKEIFEEERGKGNENEDQKRIHAKHIFDKTQQMSILYPTLKIIICCLWELGSMKIN